MAKQKSRKKIPRKKNTGKSKTKVVTNRQMILIDLAFVFITGSYFLLNIFQDSTTKSFIENTTLLHYSWLFAIAVLAVILIWQNRKHIDKPKPISQKQDLFAERFSRLSKIPLVSSISELFYKQGLWVNISLLILCILSGILYTYNLGYYGWLPDEPLVVKAAKGFLESGTFRKWDFWNDTLGTTSYNRAWPHSILVALSFKFFGVSEVSARMVSVIAGIFTVPIFYFVANYFLKNRFAALAITCCFIFHPYAVHYFRRTRMYAVLIPLFLGLFYVIYKAITEKKSYSNRFYNKFSKLNQFLNFHWVYVILALFLIYISYEIHKVSVIILPCFFLFFVFLLFYRPEKRLFFVAGLGFIPVLYLLVFTNTWERLNRKMGLLENFYLNYWEYLYQYPISVGFSIVMLAVAILWAFLSKQRLRLIPILMLLVISTVLYIYLIDNPPHYRYVIHIIPFSMIICLGILLKINSLLRLKYLKLILPTLLIAASISIFIDRFDATYYKNIEAVFPQKAYSTISNNIKPGKEAIFSLYFTDLYMRGKGNQLDLVRIKNRRRYSLGNFRSDLGKYEAGWVTWATGKTNHIDQNLLNHLVRNCQKYHGYGLDNTKTEVFYCKN